MPDKYYQNFDSLQAKASLHPLQMSTQLKVPASTLAIYHAKLRAIQFQYPADWKLKSAIVTEEAGIKREHVILHNPIGGSPLDFTLAEVGKDIYFNPGNYQSEHEVTIITAKALNIPGWDLPVFYVEILVQRPNGTFAVLYGLRSQHPLYDHVHTFTTTQDEIPLVVSEPKQADPYIGFLVFMSGWWGFKTKTEALAILKTPAHKASRSVILTTRFTP